MATIFEETAEALGFTPAGSKRRYQRRVRRIFREVHETAERIKGVASGASDEDARSGGDRGAAAEGATAVHPGPNPER